MNFKIQVYCNFTTGATEVLHDTEVLIEVEHCHDPGEGTLINYFQQTKKEKNCKFFSCPGQLNN